VRDGPVESVDGHSTRGSPFLKRRPGGLIVVYSELYVRKERCLGEMGHSPAI